MDFRYISAGELAKDQYVTVLGLRPQKKEIVLPMGEIREITEEDKNPWIKGVPFRILNVKLPIVMLHNICQVPNIPPAVFYDTRLVEFLEVDEEYAVTYKMVMFPPQPATPQVLLINPINPNADQEDDQQVFNFGGEESGGMAGGDGPEQGPPPLVPK